MEEIKVGKISIPIIKGEKGDVGPAGATGPAGKTPQAGIDYYTEEEKTQMQENILSEVLSEVLGDVKTITFDEETGIFTIIRNTGESYQIDLPIERLVKSGYYDEANKQIVLNLDNDTTIVIPVSSLIDDLNSKLTNQATKIEELEEQNKQLLKDYKPIPFEGVSNHIVDTGELPILDFGINGGIEQDTREGYNHFKVNPQPKLVANLGNGVFDFTNSQQITINSYDNNNINFTTNTKTFLGFLSEPISLKSGETLTVTGILNGSTSLRSNIVTLREDGSYNSLFSSNKIISTSNIEYSYTATEDIDVCVGFWTNGDTTYTIDLTNLMATTKANATYEDYGQMPSLDFPSEVKGVSGHYDTVVSNKNVFDGELELGNLVNGENATHTDVYRSKNYQKIKPNANYAFSFDGVLNKVIICMYDKDRKYIGLDEVGLAVPDGLFTTYANAEYLRFRSYGSDMLIIRTAKIQLEENTVATDYVEHKEQLLPIDIPTETVLYSGKPYKENGKWYRPIEYKKEYLSGKLNGRVPTSNSSKYSISFNLDNARRGGSTELYTGFSNLLKATTIDNIYNHFKEGIAYAIKTNDYYGTGGVFYLEETSQMTLEQANAYITEKGMYVVYPLAKPEVEEITDTTLIAQLEALEKAHSYYEVTNINSYRPTEDVAEMKLSGNALMSNDLRMSKLESALLNVSAEV